MRKKTIFLVSLLMAGLATLLFYQYTNQLSQEASAKQQMATVIAAATPIAKDQEITADMLKNMEVPADRVHPKAVLDAANIVGKYAATMIAVDEVILQHHMQSLEEATFLSGKIQQGYRAVTIPGGKVETIANMIEPEDMIDIIYTGPPLAGKPTDSTDPTVTMVLQEKVRVLAVGRRMKTTDAFVEYDTLTVDVQQSEAVELIDASKTGVLNLILYSKMKVAEEKAEGS